MAETPSVLMAEPPSDDDLLQDGAPGPAPEEAPKVEHTDGRPRGADGKFAAKEPEPAKQPEPEEDPRDRELRGLKAAVAEARAKVQELERRQQPQQPAKEPEPEPDPEIEDPLAELKTLRKEAQELRQWREAQERERQIRTIETEAGQILDKQLAAYRATDPSIDDQVSVGVQVARMLGHYDGMTPQQVETTIKQWMVQTTLQCQQLGINPAVVLAQKSMEFQQRARELGLNVPSVNKQQPAAAAAQPEPAPEPAPAAKAEPQPSRLAEAKARSASLSGVPGGRPAQTGEPKSLENIADLPWQKWTKETDSAFDRIMRG